MVIIIIAIIFLISWFVFKHDKKQEQVEKSKYETHVEDFLWLIKLLKSNGFELKNKSGINTSHVVLTFENSNHKVVSIEQDYTALDNNQGKLFLVSDNKKMRTYFYHTDDREKEILIWLDTL